MKGESAQEAAARAADVVIDAIRVATGTPEPGCSLAPADEGVQWQTMTLTVHLTLDDRYEDGCVADEALARLAADGDAAWWTEGVQVDAVTSVDGPAWGYHLTELAECPHCRARLDVPLADGLGCTNEWHHLGHRARRAQRRQEIRAAS